VNINIGIDKVVHVSHQALCDENIWESASIAPHIHVIHIIQ
jgi:hypothetical protein